MSSLEGKTIFVTGANRGIGRAFVEEALAAGAARVYAGVRDLDSLAELAATTGGKVQPVELDVTKPDQIEAAAKIAKNVDLLINNAGIARFSAIIASDDIENARAEMETNYFGVLNMVRAFAPVLKANGGGGIINVSSIAAYMNFPAIGSYSASKAAVHSLTQAIRAELASQGTHVAGVYPGPVDTEMVEDFPMDKTSPSDVAKAVYSAYEQGEEDIYPDVAAKGMREGYRADPKAAERQAGEMLP